MNTQVLPEGWREVKLGDIADIKTGERNNQDKKEKGKYPFFVRSEKVERIDTYSFDGEAILIPGEGKISEIIHHIVGRFDYHQRVYKISGFQKDVFGKFVFYYLQQHFPKRAVQFSVKATADSLRLPAFSGMAIGLPSFSQQKAIAEILQTWDAAIEKTESLIAAKEKRFKWFCVSGINGVIAKSKNTNVRLSDIFEFQRGNGLSKSDIKNEGKNKCVLYGQLYTTYEEVIHEVKSLTNISEGVRSKSGDVLMPTSTTTSAIDLANATAILEGGVLLGGEINIMRPKTDAVDGQFMAYFLTHCKKHDLARLAQGITIIHLYSRDIKRLQIALPPIGAQTKMAELLNLSRREINQLKALAEKYRAQKRGIMQKLLTGKWRVNCG